MMAECDIWTVKYAPQSIGRMAGSTTPQTAILKWLREWRPEPGKNKPALVTGPSGCGKTLLARLAFKEVGIGNVLEINCMQKRSKKAVKIMCEAFSCRAVLSYAAAVQKEKKPGGVILDEADCCDQGGLPELLAYIRKSKVPVVCVAGDAFSKSMQSLGEWSERIRMFRPTAEQVGAYLLSIYRLEKLPEGRLTVGAARALASACNCDLRQAILELYIVTRAAKDNGSLAVARNEDGFVCDKPLGLFDLMPKLFSNAPKFNFGLAERLHVMDRSMVPLMVAENYLKAEKAGKDLAVLAEAADSVSLGNAIEGNMFKAGAWDVQDIYAHFATVRPSALCHSALVAKVDMPSVLSKTTAAKKQHKLLGQIAAGISNSQLCAVPHATPREFVLEMALGFSALYVHAFGKFASVKTSRQTSQVAEFVAGQLAEYNMGKDCWDFLYDYMSITAAGKNRLKELYAPSTKKALYAALAAVSGRLKRRRAEDDDEDEDDEIGTKPPPGKRSRQ